MEIFKKEFDYIIIDTPPILSVSDTSILMSYSDVNLSLVRHNLSKVNELKQQINLTDQLGIKFDGFIYNFYEKPSSYYGYYEIYGNYAYQYYAKKYLYDAYSYDDEKN
jgi:tyrosine-protein kinase Etk/Wzc